MLASRTNVQAVRRDVLADTLIAVTAEFLALSALGGRVYVADRDTIMSRPSIAPTTRAFVSYCTIRSAPATDSSL
jgi:hypothetical protein